MVLEVFLPWMQNLIIEFSYIAVFIISLISTSTIFIPFPLYVVIFFAAGLGLNPLLVGISAGLGSTIGELTGYFIGVGGKHVVKQKIEKVPKTIEKFTKLFKKYGLVVILLTSFFPFPFDVIGILCGATGYNLKKFFIATFVGKLLKTLIIAYVGFITIPYVELFIQSVF